MHIVDRRERVPQIRHALLSMRHTYFQDFSRAAWMKGGHEPPMTPLNPPLGRVRKCPNVTSHAMGLYNKPFSSIAVLCWWLLQPSEQPAQSSETQMVKKPAQHCSCRLKNWNALQFWSWTWTVETASVQHIPLWRCIRAFLALAWV